MNKYNAFLSFLYDNHFELPENFTEEFEIAWESGQFDETPKGECCG